MLIKDCPNPRPPFGENSNRCKHRFWVNMDLTFSTACEGTIRALRPLGYEIINLGNNHPNELIYAIGLIERYLEKKAHFVYRPFHKADLKATCADIKKAKEILDWEPKVSLEEGIKRTVDWYKENRSWLKDVVI